MRFLETRNTFMKAMGWNRRVATLAARIALGVDTWETIASTPSFWGTPLLTPAETIEIQAAFRKTDE